MWLQVAVSCVWPSTYKDLLLGQLIVCNVWLEDLLGEGILLCCSRRPLYKLLIALRRRLLLHLLSLGHHEWRLLWHLFLMRRLLVEPPMFVSSRSSLLDAARTAKLARARATWKLNHCLFTRCLRGCHLLKLLLWSSPFMMIKRSQTARIPMKLLVRSGIIVSSQHLLGTV